MENAKIHEHFLKLHSTYEKKGVQILIKEFRKIIKRIPFDNITPENAEAVVALNIHTESLRESLFKLHYSTGLHYGNLVSAQFKKAVQKKKKYPLFSEAFRKFLLSYYTTQGGELINILSTTLIAEVVKEIKNATEEFETVVQMRNRIYKTVNKPNFYKWQALRIARTETTFAMNSAKYVAGEISGIKLKTVWLTRIDGREREAHRAINDKEILQGEFFIVDGEKMLYPGDRMHGASASNLVNCRCSYLQKAAESFEDFLQTL